jgi:acetyl-CoA carboxylase biotin carboxyl carrier protein
MERDAEQYLRHDLALLLDVLTGTDIREIEVQDGQLSVRLRRTVLAGELSTSHLDERTESPEAATEERSTFITAPCVGTFYRAGDPTASPLAGEGSEVAVGAVVGIIEALGALTEVTAGEAGTVTRVLATDGHSVEYGQPLFELTLDG